MSVSEFTPVVNANVTSSRVDKSYLFCFKMRNMLITEDDRGFFKDEEPFIKDSAGRKLCNLSPFNIILMVFVD